MQLLCPECHQPLDTQIMTCANGHLFSFVDGVLVLLTVAFAAHLEPFAATLSKMRADTHKRLVDPSLYDQLPCAPSLQTNIEWRTRCYDWQWVRQTLHDHFGAQRQMILDVGAYNGWLSHQLARLGHTVTGIEYFRDPFDGLGARQFHTADWQPIQMDLLDLSVLDQAYDVVIMNHGLHFFPDPAAYIAQLLAKVAPGGLLMILGLQFWHDPRQRIQQVTAMQEMYARQYGKPMLLRPAAGYLDKQDWTQLQQFGLTFYPYAHYRLRNLLSRVLKTRPWWGYALAQVPCKR